MSKEELKSKFEELKLTKDELDRFSEAMKKEEFRKLLVDYAQEISDPVNRELYEKEITQLEQERGQNVTFIQPEPGFCMKTVVTTTTTNDNNKTSKCFINICTNKNIEKPTSKRETRKTGETGLVWYIPHTCSPAREDYDKSGEQLCFVYDVVFNPDSYRMAETNDRFKDLLKSSAMDTIETSFNVKLDRANVKILKNLNFKGRPTATILRRPSEQQPENSKVTNENGDDLIKPLIDQIKENNLDKELAKRMMKTTPATTNKKEEEERKQESKYTTPNYKLIHRGQSDMQDYASNDLTRYNVTSTRPKELVISIELPLCKSSKNVLLDVFETRLHLESNEPYYKLDLNLPYPVRENEAKAKFDKSKRCLNVTLTVVPFVVKIEDDYFFPSSSSSSTSTSSLPSSFEESSSLSTSPSPIIHVPTTTTTINNNNNKPIIKYSLPDLFHLNETTKTINLKLKIVNYVKDSIQIEFDSQSALNLKCESCSSSGSYIKYYSIYLSFFYSHSHKSVDFIDLLSANNNKNYQIVFIDDDYFEIKINKSNDYLAQLSDTSSELSKQAHVLLDKMSLDNSTVVNLNKIPDEIIEEEEENNNNNNSVNFENMNNLTKKEFILNFKNNAENHEKDDDDDDDDAEFEEAQEDINYQSFKLLKSGK
jgi:dynein assembly factor 2, axonemal